MITMRKEIIFYRTEGNVNEQGKNEMHKIYMYRNLDILVKQSQPI